MRTFFIILTCVAFAGWSLWARHHYTCKIMNQCGQVADEEVANLDSLLANTLVVNIDDKPVIYGYDHFKFDPSQVEADLTDNNKAFLDTLAGYLKANPGTKVKVSGNYLPTEKVKGIYETAGLARANFIRELLVQRGVSSDMLNIDSDPLSEGASLGKPLGFNGTSGPTPEELAALAAEKKAEEDANNAEGDPEGETEPGEEELVEAKFEFKNMTFSDVSFAKNSAVFKPVPNFVLYADSVSNYLADHPGQALTIIGHTDSDGTNAHNIKLGLDRAKSVRDYFMRTHKVERTRINTETKGESEPVAPNDNEANMAKNRRVNMQIN
ncbi:MAG: OmpA family protein [Bacteroidota bacterium]